MKGDLLLDLCEATTGSTLAAGDRKTAILVLPHMHDELHRVWRERSHGARQTPRAGFLAATSLSFIKPCLQRVLRPTARKLAYWGVTANQVTIVGILGSVSVGTILLLGAKLPHLFFFLPLWLLARMCFNTVDGLLANELGQKSHFGAVLDEVGDIVSDLALCVPLALAASIPLLSIALLMACDIASESVGMASAWFGAERRHEGPFGKTDRAIVFGFLGGWFAVNGTLPDWVALLMPTFIFLHLTTIVNRVRFSVAVFKSRKANQP